MRALSLHAGYRCRSSGACCTSGWGIEVRPPEEALIRAGLRSGRLRPPEPARQVAATLLVEAEGLPDGARCHVGLDATGRCLFFDAHGRRLCSIHRDLGPEALPSACRHFPRVALIGPHDVSVSLSHYCPTAAHLLFDDAVPLSIVTRPAAFPPDSEYEGLDARGHVPLLRPDAILGWDALELWEAHLTAVFAREDTRPEDAVARLERLARTAAGWSLPADGPFPPFFARALARDVATDGADAPAPTGEAWIASTQRLWGAVAEAAAVGLPTPAFPVAFEDVWTRQVAAPWRRHRRVVNRYLAARGFASWYSLLAPGLEVATRALSVALAVLQVECVRQAESCDGPLDAEDVREAVRASDLRLMHHVRPEVLAGLLSDA